MAIDFELLKPVAFDLHNATESLYALINEAAEGQFSSPHMANDVPFTTVQKQELKAKYQTLKADISTLFALLP